MCIYIYLYADIFIYMVTSPSIQLEYFSYVKTMVLSRFSMVEFWASSFFYSCNHYIFKDRHIRNMSQIYMELQ